jgi:hypothetical protein
MLQRCPHRDQQLCLIADLKEQRFIPCGVLPAICNTQQTAGLSRQKASRMRPAGSGAVADSQTCKQDVTVKRVLNQLHHCSVATNDGEQMSLSLLLLPLLLHS